MEAQSDSGIDVRCSKREERDSSLLELKSQVHLPHIPSDSAPCDPGA